MQTAEYREINNQVCAVNVRDDDFTPATEIGLAVVRLLNRIAFSLEMLVEQGEERKRYGRG